MATKTKLAIIAAVKKWCDANEGIEYDRYVHGRSGHDVVHVKMWDIEVKCTVMCTPSAGAVSAARNAVKRLKTKKLKLIERITNGSFTFKR